MADPELAFLIDRLTRRMFALLQTRAPEFDSERIGPAGALVVLALGEAGELELREIVQRTTRDKSQVTRHVQLLERKGLVTRRPDPGDRRVIRVALTPAGQEVHQAHGAALAQALGEVLGVLSDAEHRQITALLRKALIPPEERN